MRTSRLAPLFAAAPLFVASVAQAAPVAVTGDPVAPVPPQAGVGFCVASSVSTNPASDFPQSASAFNAGMNAFFESNAASRATSVLATPFDLSNNDATSPLHVSYGDFTNAIATCKTGGCDLYVNDTTTSFGSRFRGFLAVTSAQLGTAFHFGLYSDDAVSLTLFDGAGAAYDVVIQPPVLGASAWRSTNGVTFTKAGLYPIEILYAQITADAALELSTFGGAFTDFQRPATQTPVVNLSSAGFGLLEPAIVYQTTSGESSAQDPTTCAQCDRRYAAAAGSMGCAAGSHCNAAALCVRCDDASHCGATCAPCATAQRCEAGQCVAVAVDAGADAASDAAAEAGSDAGADASADASDDASVSSPDAGGDADSGAADGGGFGSAANDGGCSCRAPRPGSNAVGGAMALVALVGVLGSRRGRRRRAE